MSFDNDITELASCKCLMSQCAIGVRQSGVACQSCTSSQWSYSGTKGRVSLPTGNGNLIISPIFLRVFYRWAVQYHVWVLI